MVFSASIIDIIYLDSLCHPPAQGGFDLFVCDLVEEQGRNSTWDGPDNRREFALPSDLWNHRMDSLSTVFSAQIQGLFLLSPGYSSARAQANLAGIRFLFRRGRRVF
jgi:hypothetical protein